MNIIDLCELFDKYEIVKTQIEIDRSYYATVETIYSDGDVAYNITSNGYIHINSVQNASYLMFIDIEYKKYLCIYKYIPESMYKPIIQKLQILNETISKINVFDECDDTHSVDNNDQVINNDVIDINTFKCTECDYENKLIYTRSKTNPEALETKCDKCKTEYIFVPSKYYKLSSKKIIYFKSEDSSRQIDVQTPKSTTLESSTISTSKSYSNTTAHNNVLKEPKNEVNKNG